MPNCHALSLIPLNLPSLSYPYPKKRNPEKPTPSPLSSKNKLTPRMAMCMFDELIKALGLLNIFKSI